LSPDSASWISCRKDFFLPVRVLSRLYRGKLLAALRAAFDNGELEFHGALGELADPERFAQFCNRLREKEWVVYSKPPFGGPEQVLKYLARYTHRVAISNHRITAVGDGSVSFRYKDYARDNRQRIMKLGDVEFLRRFLQHVLPDRLVRIRHFGFLANRSRKTKLPLCRELIARVVGDNTNPVAGDDTNPVEIAASLETTDDDRAQCPKCGAGTMRCTETFDRQPTWSYSPRVIAFWDTS